MIMSFWFAKIREACHRDACGAAGPPGWLAVIATMLLSIGPAYAAQTLRPMPESDSRVLQISPNVTGAHIGPAWTDETGRRGHYRVVIVRVGWEHAPTAVHLQWIWEWESDWTAACSSLAASTLRLSVEPDRRYRVLQPPE